MSYPESEDLNFKSIAVSAPVHIYNIYNAQTEDTKHRSMVKPALKIEGYTSWAIQSIVSFDM